jgi:hypothetical protein
MEAVTRVCDVLAVAQKQSTRSLASLSLSFKQLQTTSDDSEPSQRNKKIW